MPIGITLVYAYERGIADPAFVSSHRQAFERLDKALGARDPVLPPGLWYLQELGGEVSDDFFIESRRPYFEWEYLLDDYESWYGHELSKPTAFHTPDTWESYELVAERYRESDDFEDKIELGNAQIKGVIEKIKRALFFWRSEIS